MTMTAAVRRVPRAFVRIFAIVGLSLAAVAADASVAAAQPNMGALGEMFDDPALASYRLTSANLTKFLAATQALNALDGENFDIEDRFENTEPEDLDIGEIAAAFDSEPRIKGAINGAGMSSREYVTFLFSMLQAMFGSIAVQLGGEEALADMPNGVLKQNIQFFMEHQDEFEALDMGGDDDEG
jgi:hypothetical protein